MDINSIISPLINGLFSGTANAISADIQNDYFERQSQFTFDLNEKGAENAMRRAYKMYSDLQSPSAIVNQLIRAGLNPALMYSNGTGGIGNVENAPQAQTSGANGIHTLGLQEITDPLTMAQVANLQADTKNKEEDSKLKSSQTMLNESSNKIKELEQQILSKENEMSEITFGYKFQKITAECASSIEQANLDRANGIIKEETYQTEIQTIQQNLANLKATYALIKANKNLTNQQIDESLQRVNEMSANIWTLSSEAELKEEQLTQLIDNREWNYITKEDAKFITSEVLDTFEEVFSAMRNGQQKRNLGIILKLLRKVVTKK